MTRKLLAMFMLIGLSACASTGSSTLAEGQNYFHRHAYPEAFKVMIPSATHGDPVAQYSIGYMYYYGYGIGKDPKLAEYWFREAAKKGNPKAIEALSKIDKAKLYDKAL